MMTQIPDIAFEIDGDLVRIEQSAGCGEVTSVDLHRLHLHHLAELLGSARSSPEYRVERALLRLWGKLDTMAADCWQDEIVDRIGDGLAYRGVVYDAQNLIEDLMEDLGIAIPASVNSDEPEAARPRNEKSPRNDKSTAGGISVTQASEEPRRGRPATGTALSNAERQARHRAKQADLLTENA